MSERSPLDIEINTLDKLLNAYKKVKKENLFDCDQHVQDTNQTLLRDAAMLTRELSGKERVTHENAKAALLLWCTIYCDRVLLKRYSKSSESKESILYGVKLGVTECFESLRDQINEHFATREGREEVARFLRTGTVRAFMLRCATQRVSKEFLKRQKDLLRIEPDEVKKYQAQGICVIETKEGNFYIHKHTSLTPANPDGKEEFLNPEVVKQLLDDIESGIGEIDEGGMRMMDDHYICEDFDKLLKSMVQRRLLSELELELMDRIYFEEETYAAVERDWKARNEEGFTGTIGNFARKVKNKIINEIKSNPEWCSLSFLLSSNGSSPE